MTRLQAILYEVWSSLWRTFTGIFAPAHDIAQMAAFGRFTKPTEKITPEDAQKLAVENFNQLFKLISDPKTDPVQALVLRLMMIGGTLPFTLGSAASIMAQKNLLTPLTKAFRPLLLDRGDAVDAFYRKVLDNKAAREILQNLGFEDSDIETMLKLALYVPSAQDIITFAVREVYNPAVVERFGQLEGFDEMWKTAEEDATAARLPKETLAKFWAAHWVLPSVNQAYEMLHRGFITPEDLDKLLVAADVMPFWRQKLKDISYATLTRVDIRRMHKLGVLNEKEVLKAYQDIGYNAENAKLLTDYTIKYNGDPETAEETQTDRTRNQFKDLTKAEIVTAYSDRLITALEANQQLYELGYSEAETSYIIGIADYKNAVADVKDALKNLKDGFLSGVYTEGDITAMLGKLALPAAYTDMTLSKWILEKAVKVQTPTKAEILAWFKDGTLTQDETAAELSNLGYPPKYIELYLKPKKKAGA